MFTTKEIEMADAQSVYSKTLDAMNEASDLAGIQRFPDQIAALQAKISAAKAAAQADKDADNASVAGQGVLDALS
jgi:class 3 adenylate cyclase